MSIINFIVYPIVGFSLIFSTTLKALECRRPSVPVTGFAKAFVGNHRIDYANIRILETNQQIMTDQYGRFCFCALPHRPLTLEITKTSHVPWNHYKRTQIATVFAGNNGFIGRHQELTLQVPRQATYEFFKKIIMFKQHFSLEPCSCQVAVTITAKGKTLYDDLQGEENAEIVISHRGKVLKNIHVLYFDILFNKTNPFILRSDHSTLDGGAIIYNLPASRYLYQITAKKPGLQFSTEYFNCRPNSFINLSPPHGVTVITRKNDK